MIYTVGHRESYEKGLKESKPLLKSGPREDYDGGCAFYSEEEAREYIEKMGLDSYEVYGLLGDWNTDTEKIADAPFNRILKDLEIIKLEN